MFKRLFSMASVVIVTVLGGSVVGLAEPAEAAISCDVLQASATIFNVNPNPVYRLNGTGPGLPTEVTSVRRNTWVTITWSFYGPATWNEVSLEWSAGNTEGWLASDYDVSLACAAAGCDVDLRIPFTAVVGRITEDATVFQLPEASTVTDAVLEGGQIFWMDGLDTAGMYRQVLVNCTWAWVEASKTGPNYNESWIGRPLPMHTVTLPAN